jgi:hypothetical protein
VTIVAVQSARSQYLEIEQGAIDDRLGTGTGGALQDELLEARERGAPDIAEVVGSEIGVGLGEHDALRAALHDELPPGLLAQTAGERVVGDERALASASRMTLAGSCPCLDGLRRYRWMPEL